jgi:hypothetical protein
MAHGTTKYRRISTVPWLVSYKQMDGWLGKCFDIRENPRYTPKNVVLSFGSSVVREIRRGFVCLGRVMTSNVGN